MNLSFPPTSLDLLRLSFLPSPAISLLSLPFIPTTFVHNVLPILVKFTKPDSKSGLWQAGRHHRTLSKLRLSDRIFILPLTANYSVFTCSASTHLCTCEYLKSTYTYIGKIFNWFYFLYFLFFFFSQLLVRKCHYIVSVPFYLWILKCEKEEKKEKEVFGVFEVIYIFIYSLSSYFVRRYDKVWLKFPSEPNAKRIKIMAWIVQ